ncbi:MAG: Gfo/Idh/MocA family oxidoreductase [Actinomycetia bacterium]|nr:Gfo/Idh/MocA family oxidoreductase [Actinomycetes bacterium]
MATFTAPLIGVLVGCGYSGDLQLSAWSRIEAARIAAVSSLHRTDAEQCARKHGVPEVFDGFIEMLDKVQPDFVDIATPPETHLKLVTAAAERGIQVLCQKPMATSPEEVNSMIVACEKHGTTLTINENARFQPWFREIKKILDAGTLGHIRSLRIASRARLTLPRPDFGAQGHLADASQLAIMELGVHHLDTARYLLGEPDLVFAIAQHASSHVIGEDTALIVTRHGGAVSTIDISWASPPWPPEQTQITWSEVRIEGDDGIVNLSYDGLLEVVTDAESSRIRFPAEGIAQGYESMQRHFIDSLLKGLQAETSGQQMAHTMDLVFAAYESAEHGVAVAPGNSPTIAVP